MPIVVCGINHTTADIAIRERVAFPSDLTIHALRNLLDCGAANEAVLLSTCNRTELYSETQQIDNLMNWLNQYPHFQGKTESSNWYWFNDEDAVRHGMRVACGLDSMLIGEPQIFGQIKDAFTLAQQTGAVGGRLQRLFQSVFSVAKQTRADTQIGASPVSIAYMAVVLAKRIFADLTNCTVLLVGAGDTIELVAMHLANSGIKRIIFANRSIEKAQLLANKFYGSGVAIGIADVPVYLPQADIVFTATASPLPIIGKGMVERALKSRKRRPHLFMVDLAIPRDIEPEIAELKSVYLYNIDDMQKFIAENLKTRQTAAEQAEAIIEIEAKYFMRELQTLDAVDIIRSYREKILNFQDKELAKALAQLQKGEQPQLVLTKMANALVNKILHEPTSQIRQAAFDGQSELLLIARRLLNL